MTEIKQTKIDFTFDLLNQYKEHQEAVFTGHVQKINTLLAVEGLTLAILIEKMGTIRFSLVFTYLPCFLTTVGCVLLFSSLVIALQALLGRQFKHKPELEYIYTNDAQKQNLKIYKEYTIADIKDACTFNQEILEKTANLINKSIIIYVSGLFVLLLALIRT